MTVLRYHSMGAQPKTCAVAVERRWNTVNELPHDRDQEIPQFGFSDLMVAGWR